MKRWLAGMNQHLAAGFCAVLVISAVAAAAWVRGNVTVHLDGVDSAGSADASLGVDVTGKAYKDVDSGLIIQLAHGTVGNNYGRFRVFADRGLTVTDPEDTSITHTSTNDIQVVSSRGRTGQVAVWDPASVPPE